ncbi:MAG: hypothetical protein C0481_04010 [Phenylobacterium sp.]|uniref:helix-turn-helix transcriptional regulator n=1 Tax=Phenylobacterium sp. TaxID=1871053 RepID=UPI0025DE7C2E|nr:AlpA family phage regulatory protein [Phenylobacterium sp.]MBA4011009.1 hypothetical protein [Phenylobacterium sp.]
MSSDPLRLTPPGRLLAWPAVRQMVGISRTTAWRLQNTGAFPLPVVISAGRVGWREEDIAAWTASLASHALRRRKMTSPTDGPEPPASPLPPARPRAQSAAGKADRRGVQQLGFDF